MPDKSNTLSIFIWLLLGALVVGMLGFAIGFFGPLIFMPEANQGPLVGIFFTGPAGVIIGAIVGVVIGWRKFRRS